MRWRVPFCLWLGCIIALPAHAAGPPLREAEAALSRGNGVAAEQSLWAARRAGVADAQTRPLMAQAFLLQGDASRALQEADPALIIPKYANYARAVRIKADLLQDDLASAQSELDIAIASSPEDAALWIDQSNLRSRNGDIAGAFMAARRALLLNRDSPETTFLVATFVRDQAGPMTAVPWYQRTLTLAPNNIQALLGLAAIFGDTGHSAAALAITRRILTIDRGNATAYFLQAVIAARAGHFDLAKILFAHINGRLDSLPAALLLRALIENHSGNSEVAISQLKAVLVTQPDNLRIQRLLGTLYAKADDPEATITTLQPIADRPDADSYTLTTIARAYEEIDNRIKAAAYLDRASVNQTSDAVPFNSGYALSLLARNDSEQLNNPHNAIPLMQALIREGDWNSAELKAERLAVLNPGAPLAYIILGDTLFAQHDYLAAVSAYKHANALQTAEPFTLRLLSALQRAGNNRAAGELLAKRLITNPMNTSTMRLAVEQLISTGRWQQALQQMAVIRSSMGNEDAYMLSNLAVATDQVGDPARALIYAREAYARAPNNSAVAGRYGWILFHSGNNQRVGVALLEKAVAQAPKSAQLRMELKQAYHETARTQ